MRGAVGRPPKESYAPDRKAGPFTTPTAADPWQFINTATNGRDSDASFCSSRPSSSFSGGPNRPSALPIGDRSHQKSAIGTINSYLSSYSFPISLRLKPLPSNKDITETLKFVLTRLDFAPSNKLEEDLFTVLKCFHCPIKINKSALKAPGTPHSFPSVLAVLHWLVQIAMYYDHIADSTQSRSVLEENSTLVYALNSYLHYIRGDDDAMERVDEDFMDKLKQERNGVEESVKALTESFRELEGKLESLKTGLSPREKLEEERSVLESDVKKFHDMIEQLQAYKVNLEKMMEEKEKVLDAKKEERKRICEENEELKKKVEEQGINARDAERMKRELQLVERDIGEAEAARNAWEEKCWDLDASIGHLSKELEELQIECNQAIRRHEPSLDKLSPSRLKLGNDLQYELNAKGSTPAEVLGIDYKSTLKPALASFGNDVKKSSMENYEEFISLQKRSVENAAKIEAKRNHFEALQSRIDEIEIQINLIRKEAHDYSSECAKKALQLVDDVKAESHKLDMIEREAGELLKTLKSKLEETIMETEEEVETCARELLALIDSVSKYKEYMSTKISEMKNDLSETAGAISDIHKDSLQANLGSLIDVSH